MADKVSGILLAAKLVYTSILHQGQNITNFFALTDSIDAITIKHHQLIKKNRKIIWIMSEYCDVYNMIHHYRAGRIADENPMTTYIWLDYMRKYRALVHIIPTVIHNYINAYQLRYSFDLVCT